MSAVCWTSVRASPWAEVGDNQLRADIDFLTSIREIDGITTHWPLPWNTLVLDLSGARMAGQPAATRAAAQRVLARAQDELVPGFLGTFMLDVTNQPSVVYGFDGMGRGDAQSQISLSMQGDIFSARVSLGGITRNFGGKSNKIMADGTYISAALGDVRIYAGFLDRWWGPGQISTLQLSNNARPMPQVGFERASTSASSWPVLRWLGPWRFEFFLAMFDGPQIQPNVYYSAAHLSFNPLPGLELGLGKTEQFCGKGHPCSPFRDYFINIDFATHPNNVNGEGSLELKYSNSISGVPFQVYAQMMNEDYAWLTSSGSSHLFGSSIFLPTSFNPVKLTVEYTNTIATKRPFSFGNHIYGYTYTDYEYPDGMRYRGRTLGFSLDSDSTLLSVQGNWTDMGGRFYELSLHHATIGSSRWPSNNVVSPTPVLLNMAEARISLPWRGVKIDIAGRMQDDQPRPARGSTAAIEVALRAPL